MENEKGSYEMHSYEKLPAWKNEIINDVFILKTRR